MKNRMHGALILVGTLLVLACGTQQEAARSTATQRGTILVTGATGRQGGAVARHLLDHGWKVRALTRDPGKPAAKELAARGAEVVRGDFDDPASLDAALAGVYGVFSVQTFWEEGVDGEVRQGTTLADRAKAAGVKHFVYTSVASSDRAPGVPHFESKWRIEQHLASIGIPRTILRPVSFMENWEGDRSSLEQGVLATPLSPGTVMQHIAVADIGSIAVEAFENPDRWIGRTLEIAGDSHTVGELAEIFGRVMGHPVRVERIPWDRFQQAAGVEITAMYRWFENVGYSADLPALRKELPFLMDLETYLQKAGWSERPANASADAIPPRQNRMSPS